VRILLVEDEPKVAGFVQRGLVAERYAVDVSGNGREGWELAEAYPYDLIILDYRACTSQQRNRSRDGYVGIARWRVAA